MEDLARFASVVHVHQLVIIYMKKPLHTVNACFSDHAIDKTALSRHQIKVVVFSASVDRWTKLGVYTDAKFRSEFVHDRQMLRAVFEPKIEKRNANVAMISHPRLYV
jgi:phosphorylcholine metabolism protein LicD